MPSKRYRLTLTVEGLVHIGDGGKYGKKDYFLTKQKTIAILNAQLCEQARSRSAG